MLHAYYQVNVAEFGTAFTVDTSDDICGLI